MSADTPPSSIDILRYWDPESPLVIAWARDQIGEWRGIAKSNSIIYTMGFVSSSNVSDKEKPLGISQRFLLAILTLVSVFIQILIPILITSGIETPDGLCPNKADPLAKLVGLILCLFFVVLTISLCLSKLSGMGFLKLFCSSEVTLLGGYRYFLDLGILTNMVAMGAAGVAQYCLFIRNAGKDYLVLVLQSLAMQFVLTPDQKLMTGPWTAFTKRRLDIVMNHEKDKLSIDEEGGRVADIFESENKEAILKKVKLMYIAEASFLVIVSVTGIAWSITLTYCM